MQTAEYERRLERLVDELAEKLAHIREPARHDSLGERARRQIRRIEKEAHLKFDRARVARGTPKWWSDLSMRMGPFPNPVGSKLEAKLQRAIASALQRVEALLRGSK